MRYTLPQVSHITRKDGVFYYRRRLPQRLGEVAVSLRTRLYREAEFLAGVVDSSFEAALTQAKAAVTAEAPDLNAILRGYLKEALEKHLQSELTPSGAVPVGRWPLGMLEAAEADGRAALADRDYRNLRETIENLMERHSLPEDLRDRLGIGVLEAELRLIREAIRRAKGETPLVFPEEAEQAHAPSPPPPPSHEKTKAPASPPSPPSAPTVSALLEPFFKNREERDHTSHHDMRQERATLSRFMEVCRDRPVDTYNRGDVSRFMDTLRRLPTHYGKSPKDKTRTIAEIIAEADAKGSPRLTDKTAKRHLSALAVFFRYAMDLGHISRTQREELVAEHAFKVQRGAKEQRDSWTAEELRALFSSPVWTGCADAVHRASPGPHIIRDAKFWLPLLALFHGARLEELADLYRRDLKMVEGIWTLHIVETLEKPEGGVRRLKNKNAARLLPLHPELMRLGFLEYAQGIAINPDDPSSLTWNHKGQTRSGALASPDGSPTTVRLSASIGLVSPTMPSDTRPSRA